MSGAAALLLLDLDGVCALERSSPDKSGLEIFKLHDDLSGAVKGFDWPVAVLTHRSRKEALRILNAIGVSRSDLKGVFSAEDFLFASLHKLFDLPRSGLLKSAALPAIERKFGFGREHMAIVDDRDDVLSDLRSNGMGLCMQAPAQGAEGCDELVSFDFAEAVRIFRAWNQGGEVRREIQPLTPRKTYAVQKWSTGKNTRLSKFTVFNTVRTAARYARGLRRTVS